MPVLTIGDKRVNVDDSFLKLSPDAQNAAVDEIAATLNRKAPDKYQQAAKEDVDAAEKAGVAQTGFSRRLAHGVMFGADNTLMAAAMTPAEMIRRGTWDPTEGYAYAKAREDEELDRARKNTGVLGTGAEVLGGAVTGGGLAKSGITAARFLSQEAGVIPRAIASAVDGTVLGGFSGGMEGNGLSDRAENAAKGAAVGGALGGVLPLAGKLLSGVAAPIFANIRARANPAGYAESQVARAIHESGVSPDELSLRTVQAANEGQPQFTLADAMGNPGKRMLSTVARAPGEGRTAVVDALDARQAGQGRRVASALAEGFESPRTAQQTRTAMEQARDAAADAEYGAVRDGAAPVDVSNVVNHIDQQVAPLGVAHDRIAPDGITGRLIAYRRMLSSGETNLDGTAAGGLNDFAAAQRVRQELSDEIQATTRAGQGNRARLLGGVLRQLDASLENASSGFRQANRNFAQASRDIEGVDAGRAAAMRGRPEDTIPEFQARTPEGQRAYRAGYADPLISDAQSAAFGANKARPLTSDAFRDEAAAMAPGNDMMQRRLARENTMFETRNQAMGGSRTMDNINDHQAMSVDPHLVGQILSGNWHGAVRSVISAGHTALTGNTAEVRREVGNILLQNGANVSPAQLRAMVDRTIERIRFVQNLARAGGQAVRGGSVPALSEAVSSRRAIR